MSQHRANIEFWTSGNNGPRFLARLETNAAPPNKGQQINIKRTDYIVVDVDYSIDYLDQGPAALFRRNVYLVELTNEPA